MRDVEEPVNRTGVSAGGSWRVNPHQEGEVKGISHRTLLKATVYLPSRKTVALITGFYASCSLFKYFLIQGRLFTYKYDFISDL